MSINKKRIIYLLGALLIVISLTMTPSLLVALIYKEYKCAKAFIFTISLCLLIGIAFKRNHKFEFSKFNNREGYLIVTLCWFLSSIFGCLPFIISGSIPNIIDAFFETCSGFSTTGASILTDIEALPMSMLFWRSFTHWVGGMGIIVFAMAFLPKLGISGQLIASAETPGPTLDKLTPRFSDTAKNLYLIYLFISILEVLLLLLGGLNLFDALIHTFGTVGTGGFSNHNASVAYYDSDFVHWIIIIFMIISGTNFNLYYLSLKKGLNTIFKDEEFKFYISTITLFAFFITLCLLLNGKENNFFTALTKATFQVSSIVTATGFATDDFDIWPTFAKMLIFILMFMGASSSSTGGGVKMIRILVALKLIFRGFSLKTHNTRIISVKINKKALPSDTISNIANFIFLYIATVLLATFLISVDNFDILTNLSSVAACIANIGPGFSLVGPTMNYSMFSGFSKIILSIVMIAGRLELFTFFILFSRYYRDPNRA
ncbi:MAG: TrkH family potassium uptake protein [Peptostreptococcaceae bacterium]|nr:TrkH family potassium uptake protein [Peptostreptococcaceae bacterium]